MSGVGLDILGVVAVGVGAAALVLILRHWAGLSGRGLPAWLMPAAIGAAMLGYAIWNDYTWYPRLKAQLPDTVQILSTGAGGKAFRPWSFVIPATTRFAALDRATVQPGGGGARARVFLVERWRPTLTMRIVADCAGNRQGLVAANGDVAEWQPLAADDPLRGSLCPAAK
ncbi:hypothetical protein MLD63_15520 [Paracoccus sp. TK19116]|uniref:Uncharacterized protein n=1 Tax=Paracoccus albicereus TaxID=2922394 RepID=A0ABT1MU32_9RHOB|nr:hypothetical protein [Paracoccus albicereus]MCQ0971830.1 hypothetical protein [Paracoccus albicereus]